MPTIRVLIMISLFTFGAVNGAIAQEIKPIQSATAPVITGTASAERLRFTAPNTIVQMHLQIYTDSGQPLFDVTSKGNVLDWTLQDTGGEHLVPGSYLCVVTVKSLSGKLSQRIGSVLVQEKQVELQRVDATLLTTAQQQAVGPIEENGALTILKAGETEAATVVAHDGTQAEITRSRGALSFRVGDFFSGYDREQMRLTEEGKLGIGTDSPQAKLDVAGVIRTSKGIEFANGTKLTTTAAGSLQQTMANGTVVANATGTGTQDKIAKWTDNAGTLGDSVITESASGNIGIGAASPETLLQIGPNTGYGSTNGLLISNNLIGSQYDRAFQLAPRQTASPGTNSVLMYGLPTVNPGVTVPNQYGLFVDGKQGTGTINSYAAIATGQTASLGASNNTHLLLGTFVIPADNYAIYDNTGYKSFFKGNVGIGTNNPTAKLDVAGDVRLSGPNSGLFFPDGTSMTTAASGGTMSGTSIVNAVNDPATVGTISDARLSANVARLSGTNNFIGNQNVTGNISAGTVQSTSGGFRFPDGSVQASAASKTYTTSQSDEKGISPAGTPAGSILHLDLPAGSYLVFATVKLVNWTDFPFQDNRRYVVCSIPNQSGTFRMSGDSGDNYVVMSLHSVVTLTQSNRVDIMCGVTNGGPDVGYVRAVQRRLTAMKIGEVEIQP